MNDAGTEPGAWTQAVSSLGSLIHCHRSRSWSLAKDTVLWAAGKGDVSSRPSRERMARLQTQHYPRISDSTWALNIPACPVMRPPPSCVQATPRHAGPLAPPLAELFASWLRWCSMAFLLPSAPRFAVPCSHPTGCSSTDIRPPEESNPETEWMVGARAWGRGLVFNEVPGLGRGVLEMVMMVVRCALNASELCNNDG